MIAHEYDVWFRSFCFSLKPTDYSIVRTFWNLAERSQVEALGCFVTTLTNVNSKPPHFGQYWYLWRKSGCTLPHSVQAHFKSYWNLSSSKGGQLTHCDSSPPVAFKARLSIWIGSMGSRFANHKCLFEKRVLLKTIFSELSGIVWDCLGLAGIVWDCLGFLETHVNSLDLFGILWHYPCENTAVVISADRSIISMLCIHNSHRGLHGLCLSR